MTGRLFITKCSQYSVPSHPLGCYQLTLREHWGLRIEIPAYSDGEDDSIHAYGTCGHDLRSSQRQIHHSHATEGTYQSASRKDIVKTKSYPAQSTREPKGDCDGEQDP